MRIGTRYAWIFAAAITWCGCGGDKERSESSMPHEDASADSDSFDGAGADSAVPDVAASDGHDSESSSDDAGHDGEAGAPADAGADGAGDGAAGDGSSSDGAGEAGPASCTMLQLVGDSTHHAPLVHGIAFDSSGNTLLVGKFLTAISVGGHNATSVLEGLYVVKVAADNTVVWLRTYEVFGVGPDVTASVGVDYDGNALIAARVCGQIDVGMGTVGNSYDAQCEHPTLLMFGLDVTGQTVWARPFAANARPKDLVAVDDATFVLVGGASGPIDFGDGLHTPAHVEGDGFVARFSTQDGSSEGTHWVLDATLNAVVTDGPGAVVAGGRKVNWDAGQWTEGHLLLRVLDDGTEDWRRVLGTPAKGSRAFVSKLSRAPTGSLLLGGVYSGDLDPGSGSLPVPPSPCSWAYFARLDASGLATDAIAVPSMGTPCVSARFATAAFGILGDATGQLYLGGGFSGSINLGTSPGDALFAKSMSSYNRLDILLAQLAPDWSHIQSSGYGLASSSQTLADMDNDAQGRIVVAGDATGPLDFGCGQLPDRGGGFLIRYLPADFGAAP